MPELNVKLTLQFEREGGKKTQRVIKGANDIAYILEEAGLLDEELIKFLAN